MGSLINSNFRVRPSSKFAHTVDRVKEYQNYIGYLALSISRDLLIGGKYYKIQEESHLSSVVRLLDLICQHDRLILLVYSTGTLVPIR
jgi:hypothetical protein